MQKWLKDAVIYQIYPVSFFDANGDGIGDLCGITQKLEYVKNLGVNAIWLNPIYQSPFKDGGYDISDYYAINERLGNMGDFETLISKAKHLGLRVILDMVLGHTSDQHPWFLRSAEYERNEYSDRYIWTDNIFYKYKDISIHGMYDRDGGYLINYYANQPALNYGFNRIDVDNEGHDALCRGTETFKTRYDDKRLSPMREEAIQIMRYWLQKGVDGFRLDMASSLVKGCVYYSDSDKDIEGIKWLWDKLLPPLRDEFPDACFISEWVYPKNAVGKCGFDLDLFTHDTPEWNALVRNEPNTNLFPVLEKGGNYFSEQGGGSVSGFISMCDELYSCLSGKGYFSVPSGSHDEIRLADGKGENLLKTLYAFLLTYKHVPIIYYGDEIGMKHCWDINKDGGYVRTGARTPMQWSEEKNKGFTENENTYIPIPEASEISVEKQGADSDSLYNLIRQLLKFRKENSCLNADADIRYISKSYPLAYIREDSKGSILVAVNPRNESSEIETPTAGKELINIGCETDKNVIRMAAQAVYIAEIKREKII